MEDNKWQEPHKAKPETRSVEADQPLLGEVCGDKEIFMMTTKEIMDAIKLIYEIKGRNVSTSVCSQYEQIALNLAKALEIRSMIITNNKIETMPQI